MHKVVVAFVNDIDLVLGSLKVNEKIQISTNLYNILYTTTGTYIEYQKIVLYLQQQKWMQGQKRIINHLYKIKINEKTIKMINVSNSIRILGVHIGPLINWDI